MKKIILLAVLAIVALSSCSKEKIEPPVQESKEVLHFRVKTNHHAGETVYSPVMIVTAVK